MSYVKIDSEKSVRGRLREPSVILSVRKDGTLVVRADDDKDPAFWLEIHLSPADVAAALSARDVDDDDDE